MDSSEIFFVPIKTLFKILIWVVVILLLIGGILFFIPITEKYHAQGRIVPRDEAIVYAIEEATVKEVLVKSGRTVKKGEVLLTLQTDDLDRRKVQLANDADKIEAAIALQGVQNKRVEANPLSADLRHVDTAVKLAKAKVDHFENYVKTLSSLAEMGIVSRVEYNNAKMQALQAQAELKQGQSDEGVLRKGYCDLVVKESDAQLEQMKVMRKTFDRDLKLLEEEYARRQILAPADGLVISHKKRDPGEPVQKGEDLFHIAMSKDIKIDLMGPEWEINKVSPGQPVQIKPMAYSEADYDFMSGKVLFISKQPRNDAATAALSNMTLQSYYRIECSVEEMPKDLKEIPLGSSVQARILLRPTRLLPWLFGIGR